jgi:hypothetical protein
MPTLQFKGFAHTEIYRGPSGSWSPGDEKDVTPEQAEQLLADYGGAFESVGSAVAAPKTSRAVKSPTKRTTKKVTK